MEAFEVIVASSPDRERLVAEIWFGSIHIAEISFEGAEPEIVLYARHDEVLLPLDRFLVALEDARVKLCEGGN